ncbi:hypothetical protein U1Q18_005627, partial [Sarracenia purpurea var. burkii]
IWTRTSTKLTPPPTSHHAIIIGFPITDHYRIIANYRIVTERSSKNGRAKENYPEGEDGGYFFWNGEWR